MKLQKQLSRKIGTKEYPKWVITLPPELIKELGWIGGQILVVKKKEKTIEIKAE